MAAQIALDYYNKNNSYNPFFDKDQYFWNVDNQGNITGQPVFPYSMKREEVSSWILKTTISMSNHAYSSLGIQQSEKPISFSDEDLKTFEIEEKDVIVDPKEMSCFAFAFLRAKEVQAAHIIFKGSGGDAPLVRIFKYLKRFGYSSVQEPQEGDLVVYMTSSNNPTHVGYLTESGKVLSKLGINNPYSHTHQLFDIPPNYGTKVLFFRKNQD